MATLKDVETPAFVLLGIFAPKPPVGRLDGRAAGVLRAGRTLLRSGRESAAEMRAALALCRLVASDLSRAEALGEAGVSELVRRYEAAGEAGKIGEKGEE